MSLPLNITLKEQKYYINKIYNIVHFTIKKPLKTNLKNLEIIVNKLLTLKKYYAII